MASSLSPSLPATFSTLSSKFPYHSHSMKISFFQRKLSSPIIAKSAYTVSGVAGTVVVDEKKLEEEVEATNAPLKQAEEKQVDVDDKSLSTNELAVGIAEARVFKDPKWRGGTWDLLQFQNGGVTDWNAVIDAEARRRKWLEDNPEASSTNEPVVFDTSIIPWWAWVKRYHLPEAELLNGRAAMVGFFMAYFVDSLSGIGLVDQMGNFFCKTLLLIAVSGVMLIRKNEDIGKLKKLFDETTFYDKQWQATWQDASQTISKNK